MTEGSKPMWHVDEGALNAYLDGALDEYPAAEARRVREHLERCAACAARLVEERSVRERAREILALAAPRVEVPSFEELRAYVRSTRPARSRISVRLYRLGWAASVVLALGTGWLLRGSGIVRAPVGEGGTAERATAPDALEAAEEAGLTPPSGGEVGPVGSVAERAVQGAAVPAEAGEMPARAERAGAAGSGALADAPASLAAAPRADAPAVPTAPGMGGTGRREGAGAPLPSGSTAAGGDRSAELEARPARAAGATSAIAATAEPTPPGALRDRLSVPGALGDTASADDLVSLVVPGLEVLDVLAVGEGTTFAGMRAVQRLASGDTLELVYLPGSVSPASLAPLRVGWSELVRRRGEGWLVMRAPVSERELAELLQRLEAGH
jgi:hypothetical protein